MATKIDILPANPFMPSFGRYPKILLDQQENLNDYLGRLLGDDAKYQTSLVYGARGTGKTVFLLNVQQTIKQFDNWLFIRLNNGQGNLLFQLLHALQLSTGVTLSELFKNIQGVNVMGNGITLRSLLTSGEIDYHYYLTKLLARLANKGKHVLIGIDEIAINDDIRAFASEYQTLIGENYPLALLMTGLPSRISEVQNDKMLTFLLRSHRIHLATLDELSVTDTFAEAFRRGNRKIDVPEIDALANAVAGYAYAFQTVGYYAWRYSEESLVIDQAVVDKAIASSKKDLFRNAYERMYNDISKTDRLFLRAMAESPSAEIATQWIAKKLGKNKSYISVYRARLLEDQLIIAPQRGYVQFNLPFFKDFILEHGSLYM
ncbi:hypothetical protein [Limosilactobacillus caccae]|uniref:hypothetical protein n=1 Tax=Limosilactobacillus caccae TaxID=1926284 RepID=UPI0009704535|nr:hypothetical protein [Limosilactobacillus caccae]